MRRYIAVAALASSVALASPAIAASSFSSSCSGQCASFLFPGLPILIGEAEAANAVRFLSPASGKLPAGYTGSVLVNPGVLFNLPTVALSHFLSVQYSSNTPPTGDHIAPYFGNMSGGGTSSFEAYAAPANAVPGLPSTGPILIVTMDTTLGVDAGFAVPNMLKFDGQYNFHEFKISAFKDPNFPVWTMQASQDLQMFQAYPVNPLHLEQGVLNHPQPYFGTPLNEDQSGLGTFHWYVGQQVAPDLSKTPITVLTPSGPREQYHYFPIGNQVGPDTGNATFNGVIGRVYYWPNSPVDLNIVNNLHTFEMPSFSGTPTFVPLSKDGSNVLYPGQPAPPVYLIGDAGPGTPGLGGLTTTITFGNYYGANQGYVPGLGDTGFYSPPDGYNVYIEDITIDPFSP